MNLTDFEKLKKLMALTASANDAEALAALRAANAVLEKYHKTWREVLERVVKVAVEIEPAHHATEVDIDEDLHIDAIFKTLEDSDLRGSFASFIDDLREQWLAKRWLSPKQKEALWESNPTLAERTLAALNMLHREGFESASAHLIAARMALLRDEVETTLHKLRTRGDVSRRTNNGAWISRSRPAHARPGVTEASRLRRVVKTAPPDITFGELARRARIARQRVRPLLDFLVSTGKLKPRPDGWYEVPG